MPEYLAPGVFVEEVSFRSKSIEGVPTSTTGFAGMTRYGPVCYPNGPNSCEPRLITSFTEFERVYGGLEPLTPGASDPGTEHLPYLAHAARNFFDNGGKRLYVSRVFVPREPAPDTEDWGVASLPIAVGGTTATWRARWPGNSGEVHVETRVTRSKNLAYVHSDPTFGTQVQRAKAGAVVEVIAQGDSDYDTPPDGNDDLTSNRLRVVEVEATGRQVFRDENGSLVALASTDKVQLVEMTVVVTVSNDRQDQTTELGASERQLRDIVRILQLDDPEDQDSVVWLDLDRTAATDPAVLPIELMVALKANPGLLTGAHDGLLVTAGDIGGRESDPDDVTRKATGLEALGEIEDIAIIAAPDGGALAVVSADEPRLVADELIQAAEKARYRIAVIDGPIGSSMNEIRDFRSQIDSSHGHGACYHPWVEIADPTVRPSQGAPPPRLMLPPSGFVTGIYARNDITRGVHKAPANEVVRGLTRFEANINKARQEVLNPEGINALRFFEGRGYRVWGARTVSSDPEWKYVNVRRLFNFIEHSIDNGTQWAVFEPNGPRLWANIRRTIEDFLLNLWKDGALLGDKPEQAYFVRCDRTTMTQNDLDNGRLICLIGVAPVKPAEFVIFRIGQWTADAQAA